MFGACPNCGELNSRRTPREGIGGAWHRLRHEKAYRCRKCRTVFYVTEGVTSKPVGMIKGEEPPEETVTRNGRRQRRHRRRKGITRKRLVEIGAFVAMMVIFYVVMRYFLQERAASEPTSSTIPVSLSHGFMG